ncbi:nitroreductase family protein [Clostridium malenominatum]|uniref:Nitroreductase family protein n=1 Tax=Clostridium malenominatum TaxID=1539 RepID=A0ABP3U0S2_9CLOT
MLELVKKRRSIRKYKDIKIEKDKIEKLIECALLSPTSKNSMPWEFIIVDDKNILEELSKAKQAGGAFLKDAALAIVILGDPSKSNVWIEDTAIATTVLHLASEDMGLGSCWIQIRERNHDENTKSEDFVRKVLNIPENIMVEAIVAIGYPDEVKAPHDEETLKYEKVFLNGYNNKYYTK